MMPAMAPAMVTQNQKPRLHDAARLSQSLDPVTALDVDVEPFCDLRTARLILSPDEFRDENVAILKSCIICGRPGPTNRCDRHPKPPKRTGTYGRDSAKIRAAATVCALCGEGPRVDDPWVADHRIPATLAAQTTSRTSNPLTAHVTGGRARRCRAGLLTSGDGRGRNSNRLWLPG